VGHVAIVPTETGHPTTGFSESVDGVRTDRLVAILLLLQRRERVTAAEVARELEVSERTARRDLDALAMAGVPVYSMQGRGGGWRLVGGARTDLSGLTANEARACSWLPARPRVRRRP
jgi:predicted HTH transcriptional regulator